MTDGGETPDQRHILTVVIEDYYQVGAFSHLIPRSNWDRFESRIEVNTRRILDLLDDTGNTATFYVCGWIADNYPDLLKEVVNRGHEIACQGYFHHFIEEMTPQAFRDDVRRSREAAERAIGARVKGFRIGRGWIGPGDLWALDVLAEEGFDHDSSVCPIGRQFADQPDKFFLHRHEHEGRGLWEVPVSTWRIAGLSLPISGGNYLRQLPERPVRWAIDKWSREKADPLVFYIHVWELDPDQPSITAATLLQKLRHYRNLARMPERVRHYLQAYRFTSIAGRLGFVQEPVVSPAARPVTEAEQPADSAKSPGIRTPVTLAVPCYNEETALPYLESNLARFARLASDRYDLRFVFVDDGSQDNTLAELRSRFGGRADCKIIGHDRNRGVAAACLTGIENADTELVAVIDADCTFNPQQLLTMLPLMTGDVDLVITSPLHRLGRVVNVPAWRLMLSRGAAFLYRRVLRHKFSSYTSCFRVYRRHTVTGMALHFKGFCGVAEILGRLDLAGHRIIECPAVLDVRLMGYSKINTLRTIIDHLRLIARLAAVRWLGKGLDGGANAGRGNA